MLKKCTVMFVVLVGLLTLFGIVKYSKKVYGSNARPLRRSELMALVAGESLPEAIVYEIQAHGLCFATTEHFKTLLSNAGVARKVLSAVNDAKVLKCSATDLPDDSPLLENMSVAGENIRKKQFQAARAELNLPLNSKDAKSAAAFVAGIVLIDEGRNEEAADIYSEIEKKDPDFPQIHTRMSLVQANLRYFEEALREAKLAQERNPEDPSGHLNAGIAFEQLRKFDAAKSEIQAALRYKPDMAIAYLDLGILYRDLGELDNAIEQQKKALALEPDNTDFHFNLGIDYARKEDFVSAIGEYRGVLRLDPKNGDARENLGECLMHTDTGAAITEFRELAKLLPDHPMCHFCLGEALYTMTQYDEAKQEYDLAVHLDPTNAPAHTGLGRLLEVQKNYDAAVVEYRIAEKLDPSYGQAFTDAGRALIAKKDFTGAIAELKRGQQVDPTSWMDHDFCGQAFEGANDRDSAIAEYK
jgi:tetratricopeptide (TPR) repeat protein